MNRGPGLAHHSVPVTPLSVEFLDLWLTGQQPRRPELGYGPPRRTDADIGGIGDLAVCEFHPVAAITGGQDGVDHGWDGTYRAQDCGLDDDRDHLLAPDRWLWLPNTVV